MKNILILMLIGLPVQRAFADDQDPSAIFAKRMVKAIQIISEHHLTPTSEARLTEWSIRALYAEAKKPIPGAIGKQLDALNKTTAQDHQRLLLEAHVDLRKRREFKEHEDVDICLAAIASKLDPPERPTVRIECECRPCNPRPNDRGVGLKLESDPKTGMLRVVTPIFNGPAYKAGIRAGDLITEIRLDVDRDGKTLLEPDNTGTPAPRPQIYSTKGMTIEQAANLLRGKAGTRVTLMVIQAK